VARRWQQLSLDHASSCMPRVRVLLEELAGRVVPDLGPAAAMDQLTVLVYDACAASARHTDAAGLVTRLADLRRELA
jgi:hypothetical protein